MSQVLRARPVNVQVKHRGTFAPPRYELFKTDVGVSLAGRLAETYNLRSTGMIVNQNATSTQYLSFRHFLPGEPFRFFDAFIGIDQAEIVFSNPVTLAELVGELRKIWGLLLGNLQPNIASNYVEATLHCQTDDLSTKAFLNDLVKVQLKAAGISKGFSLTSKAGQATARIGFEVSDSIPDGLYVTFAYLSTASLRDMPSFEKFFDAALTDYRSLQRFAQIQLVEPT